MTTPETVVFKTRIGNALDFSGRVRLARVSWDDDLGARGHGSNCKLSLPIRGYVFSRPQSEHTRRQDYIGELTQP
jgi:hypothetical protein